MKGNIMELTISIDDQKLTDALSSAFEAGSLYWYNVWKQEGRADGTDYPDHPAYVIMSPHGAVWIEHTDGDGDYSRNVEPPSGKKQLDPVTRQSVQRGIAVLAEKYPWHLADIISDKGDMNTGDALLQCALFGDVIYS